MDFVMSLSLLTDLKGDNYDAILIIVNQPTKIVYDKSVKTTIDTISLVKVIINVVVWYHDLSELIIYN